MTHATGVITFPRRFVFAFLTAVLAEAPAFSAVQLRVSDNQRFLQRTDGRPFFWLADTAWELFHRLNREDADKYLKNRAGIGYLFALPSIAA